RRRTVSRSVSTDAAKASGPSVGRPRGTSPRCAGASRRTGTSWSPWSAPRKTRSGRRLNPRAMPSVNQKTGSGSGEHRIPIAAEQWQRHARDQETLPGPLLRFPLRREREVGRAAVEPGPVTGHGVVVAELDRSVLRAGQWDRGPAGAHEPENALQAGT